MPSPSAETQVRVRRSRQQDAPALVRVRRSRTKEVHTSVQTFGSVKRADVSRQIDEDNAFTAILSDAYLQPPFDPSFLEQCVERSNMLKQCIAAMVVNVTGGGYEILPAKAGMTVDEDEREEGESFIESVNSEESLSAMMGKVECDYETYGYGFIEVIRDRAGRLSVLRYCPSRSLRLMRKDAERPQLVEYDVARGKRVVHVREFRTFRRYVQIIGGRTRYFKEFGDKRKLNMNTGRFDGYVPTAEEATEIIHLRQHSPDPYGVPRWINQLPSVLGSREAEECNMRYFEDNTVPPMIMSVSGGRLTKQSYKDMRSVLDAQGVGKERQNKIILIEAVPEQQGLDDKGGGVQVKIDKLTDARQSDGLFSQYDEANQAKVRSSFRLPPVAVGLSQDVTFATARVSAFIAESQVYRPAREAIDEVFNKKVFNSTDGLALATCRMQSRVPQIADGETLVRSLTALNTMGAITPRMANEMASRVFQIELQPLPAKGEEGYEEWMDRPMVLATRGKTTHDEQAIKTDEIKGIEKSGDVSEQKPENGSE